jgi:hypothetical protein
MSNFDALQEAVQRRNATTINSEASPPSGLRCGGGWGDDRRRTGYVGQLQDL